MAGVRPDPVQSPSVSLARDSCFPAVLPDGRYASVVGPASVVLDGRLLLSDAELERLLPSIPKHARRVVSALGAGDEEVVVALTAISKGRLLPSSATLAVVGAEGKVRFSAFLRTDVLPATVGLAPREDALWYFDAADGSAHVIQIPGGRELPPYGAHWVAWSPDGHYVALARGGSIQILTWPDGVEVDSIPVTANVVYWTLAPGA